MNIPKGKGNPAGKTREELMEDFDKKTAFPDMVLKRMYFTFQETMIMNEATLMTNYYKNQGFFNEIDVIKFRGSILGLFLAIKGMILEQGCRDAEKQGNPVILKKNGVKSYYELCCKLETYAPLGVSALIQLAGYLTNCMHELGLTNLLLNTNGVEIDMKDLF